MVGQTIGPYEILDEIGRGGMARVYRAYQSSMERFVAIKVIQKSIAADPASLERFVREARLIARLEHPHILPVYDFNGQHEPPYIVMRYLPSGTLKDITSKAQLPAGEVIHVLRQSAAALDYAHRQGVIHRDIKPSNILIDSDGNAFLTDFGIARMIESSQGLTDTGIAVGTPGYMAPEQGMGLDIDGRSDVYGLAVIAFEVLTGYSPYSAETPMALMVRHISEPIPSILAFNPNLPAAVEEVMMKGLAKQPEDRYGTAMEFVSALNKALGDQVVTQPVQLKELASQTIQEVENARATFIQAPRTPVTDQSTSLKTPAPSALNDPTRHVVPPGATPPTTPSTPTPPPPSHNRSQAVLAVLLFVGLLAVAGAIVFAALQSSDDGTSDTEVKLTQVAGQTHTQIAAELGTQGAIGTQTRVVVAQAINTQRANDDATQTADARGAIGTSTQEAKEAVTKTQVALEANETATTNAEETLVVTLLTPLPTDTPTASPTLSPTPTATATSTPSATDTLTATSTSSATHTPTATDRPSATPTSTNTLTETPTPTPTPTNSPSATFTPSDTPTETPTTTPSATATWTASPTFTASPTLTPFPTPTPQPAGQMPFLADMENADVLTGWAYDAEQWRLVTEGGNTALVGASGLSSSLAILGNEVPEWTESDATDIILRMRFRLQDVNSGARLIFRYSPAGYYTLEITGGRIVLRRGPAGQISRSNELNLVNGVVTNVVNIGTWYEMILWIEGGRIFVYLDRQLIISANDTSSPIPAGGILLQTLAANVNPVYFDDIIVQRPESASDHFENASSLPSTWGYSPVSAVTLSSANNSQFLETNGQVSVVPGTSTLGDFLMSCNLASRQGSFYIRLRDSSNGVLRLEGLAGDLKVTHYDADGNEVKTVTLSQFYSRDFNVMFVEVVGERVLIWDRRGNLKLDELYPGLPINGGIVFQTGVTGDILRIDDCLFARTAVSSTAEAEFAFEILDELNDANRRPYRELATDWTEDFSDEARTREWWEGQGPGEFVFDQNLPTDAVHRRYYEVNNDGEQTAYWRIRRELDRRFTVFGDGDDRTTFRDSSDIYVKIDMRFPEEAPEGSTGWVGIRSAVNATNTGLDQYQIELTKEGGLVRVRVRPFLQDDKTYIYDQLVPDVVATDWFEVTIVAYNDRIAFFVNGRLLSGATIRPARLLGGTLSIGVEGGSMVAFDDLVFRDTSVNE